MTIHADRRGFDFKGSTYQSDTFPCTVPPEAQATIRNALRDGENSIAGEPRSRLEEIAARFASVGSSTDTLISLQEYRALLASLDKGKRVEHQVDEPTLYALQRLVAWGLVPDMEIDIAEHRRYQDRPLIFTEIIAAGLHPESPERFAANLETNVSPPRVEAKLLADAEVVHKAHETIIALLAVYGPLTRAQIQLATGYSNSFLGPLLSGRHSWEEEQRESILVAYQGNIIWRMDGKYELAEHAALVNKQQEIIQELGTSLGKAMEALSVAVEMVNLMSGKEPEGENGLFSKTSALVTQQEAAAIQIGERLQALFSFLKKHDFIKAASLEAWVDQDWAKKRDDLNFYFNVLFFSAVSCVVSLLSSVIGHEEIIARMKDSIYSFPEGSIDTLGAAIQEAFSPIGGSLMCGTMLDIEFKLRLGNLRPLLELVQKFLPLAKQGIDSKMAQLQAALKAFQASVEAERKASLITLDAAIIAAQQKAMVFRGEKAALKTVEDWAVFLNEKVRIPGKMVETVEQLVNGNQLEKNKALVLIDRLEFPHVTPEIVAEAKTFLKANIQQDRETLRHSVKSLFVLRDKHKIGSRQYGDRKCYRRPMVENSAFIERSQDANFITEIYGLRGEVLACTPRISDVTSYPSSNPDLLIDLVVATVIQDMEAIIASSTKPGELSLDEGIEIAKKRVPSSI